MPYISGNTIVDEWTVLDLSDNPLTGITSPAGITLTLLRQSGSTFVAASEIVSWTEIGATGRYYFSFTPTVSGRYVLELRELSGSSAQRQARFPYDILSAGSAFLPTYANAFCSEADVERWLQQAISQITKPSDTEAAAFAETRAARLASLCAGLGYPVTTTTVVAGSRLEDLLRDANAIGAAVDYTVAQSFGTGPSKTDRATFLEGLWVEYVGGTLILGLIALEIKMNLVSLSTNHTLSGDTIAAASTYPTDAGIQVTMSDTF